MPDFWQFPTVSMGLGPMNAIYQARFNRYLAARGIADTSESRVWGFLGDGEMDEPEALGALGIAAREGLDNLIFVVNCNLQRLDGPVRGNGKIIQELEGNFRGAGWNVIKTIWGTYWDPLLARDTTGKLRQLMMETVDGEYQNCKAFGGKYTRENFFGKYPETAALVANLSDDDIWRLNRGGHDPHKVYAAYHEAVNTKGMPTVILAKTVKGYGMGSAGEALNPTHQTKKLDDDAVRHFRDRFNIPVTDAQLADGQVPFYHPGPDSPEVKYLQERRAALGGYLPQRRRKAEKSFVAPKLESYERLLKSSGERSYSTTMAFVQSLNITLRDKELGPHIVPIVADEARTFGMEGLFRQIGIYAPFGQKYKPVDADQLMFYREDQSGQVLQQGISEPGAISSWMAAGTSYSVSNVPMLPFYIYYSMFGCQRVGDIAWQAADMRTRGFLLGGTAGRTTLNGEGLQHEDGHSHLAAGGIPNVRSYDPTFGFEVTVILQHGTKRMMEDQVDEYYYLTLMNENYTHPEMPEGAAEGIVKGMYLLTDAGKPKKNELRVQLMGSGTILREAIEAAALLEKDFGVTADIWSCPSYNELRRDGFDAERWNRLHPEEPQRKAYVTELLEDRQGPVIAATDYVRAYADQIRAFVPATFTVLGTDGFGRSDTRANLRRFFEVDRYYIAHAAIAALAKDGKMTGKDVARAIKQYKIDPEKANPVGV
jgi:pyruvate dehydrogenase E1 component